MSFKTSRGKNIQRCSRLLLVVYGLWFFMGAQAGEMPIKAFVAEYELLKNGSEIGITRLELKMVDDTLWQLSSESKATGLLSLVVSGSVTERTDFEWVGDAVQVKQYDYIRTTGGGRRLHLLFDWEKNSVSYQEDDRKGVLIDIPEKTIDSNVVNFALMISMKNKEENVSFPVTNGRSVKYNDFTILSYEKINTPMGDLNTVKVSRKKRGSREGNKTITLWLSIKHSYLPVKIEKEKSGDAVSTLIITRLK